MARLKFERRKRIRNQNTTPFYTRGFDRKRREQTYTDVKTDEKKISCYQRHIEIRVCLKI